MIVWSQGTPVPSSMGSFPVAMPRVAGLLPRLASSILFSLLFESSSLLPCRAASPPRSPESPSSRRLTPPFPLTSLGKSIRRVVVPTMLPSVCRSSDWRGELPRWFARFLPEAPVVVWDARRWHKVGGDPRVRPINCMVCQDPGRYYFASALQSTTPYDCSQLSSLGVGDLVVTIGTGEEGCVYNQIESRKPTCTITRSDKESLPSVHEIEKLWKGTGAHTVHFPVRALNALSPEHNIFGFHHIIPDNTFLKPMSGEAGNDDATKVITGCYGQERTKDLLYVARYQKYKGQLKFLLLADPGLLRGYTIHFYGGDKVGDDKIAQAYVKSIEEAAERRGIKVQLHSRVSRSTLLRHVCVASGQLLWPSTDQNPRAAYEGLYAGIPLFTSPTAGIPESLLEQPFVRSTPFRSAPEDFNAALSSYMDLVQQNSGSTENRAAIVHYTKTSLAPQKVYLELCQRVGICAGMGGNAPGHGALHAQPGQLDLDVMLTRDT